MCEGSWTIVDFLKAVSGLVNDHERQCRITLTVEHWRTHLGAMPYWSKVEQSN